MSNRQTPQPASITALAEHLCEAVSADAEQFEIDPAQGNQVTFWINGTNREFYADGDALRRAFVERGSPGDVPEGKAWISHVSGHYLPDSEIDSWGLVFRLDRHDAVLTVVNSCGDYSDDDYDMHMWAALKVVEPGGCLDDLVRAEQQQHLNNLLNHVAHTLRVALELAPEGLVPADDPQLLESLRRLIDRTPQIGQGCTGVAA